MKATNYEQKEGGRAGSSEQEEEEMEGKATSTANASQTLKPLSLLTAAWMSRAHLFNQLLIALSIFDILFIVCSVPVYSFPLFHWLEGNQVRRRRRQTAIQRMGYIAI